MASGRGAKVWNVWRQYPVSLAHASQYHLPLRFVGFYGAGQTSMAGVMLASGSVKQNGGVPLEWPRIEVPLLLDAESSSTLCVALFGTQPANQIELAPLACGAAARFPMMLT
jgi:hypothetical protein